MNTRRISQVLPLLLIVTALAWPSTALAQDPDALWRAGQQSLQSEDFRGCIDNMRGALSAGGEAYDRWGWLHMVLGVCLGQRGQRDEAISELQTALELISEDSERWSANNSLAQVYVARGNSGDYDRAIAAENEAGKYATTASQRAVHSKTLGQAYYFKEDWRNAIRHLGDAATGRNTDADVAGKLGRAYMESGDSDQARTWFEKTLTLDRSNASAITNLGRLYLNEANWPQAVRYLEQAVQRDPQNMQIRNMMGRAYLGSSRYNEAIAQLSQVVQSRGSNGNAHYNLGQAYGAAGNDAQAISSYSNALRYLAGGSPIRADCLYDLGFMYEKVGSFEDALAALEDSASISAQSKTTEAIDRVKERIRRQAAGS